MTRIAASNNFEVYASADRSEMLRFVPEASKRILDVGCGVGNFGALLKSTRNVEVWGVEADHEAASIAGGRLDRVINQPFDGALNLQSGYFDCLVFNDVLEHMIDPFSALLFAKELLNDSGSIVASIPNVRYFGNIWLLVMHGSWEYTDTGILDRTHLRFFTKKSIYATVTDLGFDVKIIEGINPVEKIEPYFRKKFKTLNLLSGGFIEDMRWMQFAIVAIPKPLLHTQ